jgi:hypothetical protein
MLQMLKYCLRITGVAFFYSWVKTSGLAFIFPPRRPFRPFPTESTKQESSSASLELADIVTYQ